MSKTKQNGKHTPGPHLLVEAGYWRDPIQVLAGVCWFVAGIVVGASIW